MENKILVANRGEIAIRVMRACRELGIPSVAVYSEADKDALFMHYADEAYFIGPAPSIESYLNIKNIIEAARKSGATAIHPGYGFLAENPNFAYACESEDINFIGPSSRVIELMGNKIVARRELQKAGVPVVPGTEGPVTNFTQAQEVAGEIGYPVIIKPSGGGGGIGMMVAHNEAELTKALDSAQSIAAATFGLAEVYIEKYLVHPRHIEFQIMADTHGNVIHLGERECSIQRRHQKLIEEAPSPALNWELRSKMGEIAVRAGKWIGYRSAGTLEFLFSEGQFYFLEANTRIQVEHPVTEMVTGVDIAKEQILVALGHPLSIEQGAVRMFGSAIECRINAEDPSHDFVPSPGKLRGYRSPGGMGVRVDSGVHPRYTIPSIYDPMISKLVTWGRDRTEAIARMKRALYEYIITGVKTNIPFHKAVMENSTFVNGELGTHFIDMEKDILLAEMERVMQREKPLDDKLAQIFEEKKRVAAMTAVAALAQMHRQADTPKYR